jgi:hypothetical protein
MTTNSTDKPRHLLLAGRWNPYLVGAGIGILSMLVFWLADNPLGISTGLSQASGACAAAFMGWEKVGENAYWAKHVPPCLASDSGSKRSPACGKNASAHQS